MCGRYLRRSDKQRIAEYFRVHGNLEGPSLTADYNVAPSTHQPVIRLARLDPEQPEAVRGVVLMRWGLIPFHAKSLDSYKGVSTINARAETITKGLWKRPFERHRCLIPADGFYEWKTTPGPTGKAKPKKQPFAFSLRGNEPFAFAGLWYAWRDPATPDGPWLQSFSIVTTDANELMSTVHTRMLVILHPRDYARWLDRSSEHQPPIDLLRPFESQAMQADACNPLVGNPRNNGPEMLNSPDESGDAKLPLNSA